MKYLKFILIGILFGITMYKTEAVSWFRIYEMFHFQSFHMYGIIMTSVILGMGIVQLIKRSNIKSIEGQEIVIHDKSKSVSRYLFGGIIFGLGWALAGACPGPMFVLLGSGHTVFVIFLISALLGTFLYGLLRDKLPH